MTGTTRKALAATIGCLAVITLAGCQAEHGPFTSGEAAELPSGYDTEDVIDSSVRLLGNDSEGLQYFVAKKEDTSGELSCVVVIPPEEEGSVICGGIPLSGTYKNAHVALSGMPAKEGFEGETVGTFLQVTRS